MGYALDLITVAVINVFAVSGYKKGILKTVISIVGTLLASLISSVLSQPIAEAIYNGSFKTSIISKAESAMKLAKNEGGSFLDSLLKTMPSFIGNSLSSFGLTSADLNAASQNGSAQLERTIAPIVISFISSITSVVLFVLLMIVVRAVCSITFRAMDETPLNFLDSFVGAAIGIAEGFVIIMLAAFIIRISTPLMSKPPKILSDESISNSTVFKGIYNSSVITGLVSAVTDSPNTDKIS